MRVILDSSTKKVVTTNFIEATQEHIKLAGGLIDRRYNINNTEIIDVDSVPNDILINKYKFIDGSFAYINIEQANKILAEEQEELTAKKIKKGEDYIKNAVKDVVNTFNTKYGVNFGSIYHMAIYKDDTDYPLHSQCTTLIKWQNSMWVTARANQSDVLDGTMTQDEFLAALPTPPDV